MNIQAGLIPTTTFEAATNCWTQAEESFYVTLPKLVSFQSIVGAADEAAAIPMVFLETPRLPDDSESYEFDNPIDAATLGAYGLIGSSDELPYTLTRGEDNQYEVNGVIVIEVRRTMLEHAQADHNYFRNEARWMKNRVGDLMAELYNYFPEYGGPFVSQIQATVGVYRAPESETDTLGGYQAAQLQIAWGEGVG